MNITPNQEEFARWMIGALMPDVPPRDTKRKVEDYLRHLARCKKNGALTADEGTLYRRLCRGQSGKYSLRAELGDTGELRPIPGHPGYVADSAGYIIKRGGKIAGVRQPEGRVYIDGKEYSAARLMLETFVGSANGRYAKCADGDNTNIALSNLSW